ncbi:MAG: hypothetical protein A4E70_01328 [Syntrophus sp. PtaU1.Bin005]|jgi:hypothetical protein|nr:MAG: hypothetical protein A4E70_01328 [Syntrophus sp. PtaU1.Bin005]
MNTDNPLIKRFNQRLSEIPEPGGGQCHVALLGVANVGVMAGVAPEIIFDEIRQSIPPGRRKVSDREIQEAINRALQDTGKQSRTFKKKSEPVVKDGKEALKRILEKSVSCDEADLWDASPYRLSWEPSIEDAIHFLKTFFHSDDLVFIGDRTEPGIPGTNIRTVADWISFFKYGGTAGPFFIINPLDGIPRLKNTYQGETYRGDQNIKVFRHALIEFDDLSHDDQIRFWMAINLPVRALIDTGGKSIHGLIDVSPLEIRTADDWNRHIKQRLYDERLVPLGVDRACKNPARLSRLPGVIRQESGKMQRLLWLSPTGRRCMNV